MSRNRTANTRLLPAALVALLALWGCSRLSPEARKIVGDYYIPEISVDEPLIELNPDATCRIRAIRPALLTYSLDGRWDVVGDSLVALLDPSTLVWEGDSTLIGDIETRYSRHIAGSTETTLTIERDGIEYVYHCRRPVGKE
ncbi:MAG: hypothetical protein NC336_09740 [Clostridium sp.]|nr:hypothetical protein [Clostridium sp.]